MAKTSKETLIDTVSTRLKELRKAKTDLGQKDVANELGITKQALSNYESGRHLPDQTALIDLANYYSCTTDYIYGLTDNATHTVTNYSDRESVNEFLQAMNTVAEDEGNYIASTTAELLNALSISENNPKRREFIELFGELNGILAEYVRASTASGTRLSQNEATANDVAIEAARFYGYDDIAKVIEDIRRTGFAAVMNFSANSKKELRIRTGWNTNKHEGSIRKRKDGIWEARVTVGMDANGRQIRKSLYGKTKKEAIEKMKEVLNGKETRTK